jgi:hypothetical protein
MATKLLKDPISSGEISIDAIFIVIYSIAGVVLVFSSVKTLRVKDNRTLDNYLMILAILMTVLGTPYSNLIFIVRIVTLFISLFVFDLVGSEANPMQINGSTIADFICSEIPIFFIMCICVVQLFQW